MKKSPTKKNLPGKGGKPVNGAAADWIGHYAVDPEEVRLFCSRHDLFQDGDKAVTMAKKILRPRHLRVVVEGDPEGTGEWLVLDVDMQGPVDEALAAYHRLKKEWLTHLPAARRGLMRLLYNIV